MKNQYFGDIGDYITYSILRNLTGQTGLKLTVCWMLTANDGRSDGRFIKYLYSPTRWRQYDPPVFDLLVKSVLHEGRRDIAVIEKEGIIPNTRYYSAALTDDIHDRRRYFQQLNLILDGSDIVFLDPDNGMEIISTPIGQRNSSKYLYWDELTSLYTRGYSLLIYQHFNRRKRTHFIREIALKMLRRTTAASIISMRTPHAAFFLIPQERMKHDFYHFVYEIDKRWQDYIYTLIHTFDHDEPVKYGG